MSQSLLLLDHTGDPNETQTGAGGGSFLAPALDQWPELQGWTKSLCCDRLRELASSSH